MTMLCLGKGTQFLTTQEVTHFKLNFVTPNTLVVINFNMCIV